MLRGVQARGRTGRPIPAKRDSIVTVPQRPPGPFCRIYPWGHRIFLNKKPFPCHKCHCLRAPQCQGLRPSWTLLLWLWRARRGQDRRGHLSLSGVSGSVFQMEKLRLRQAETPA